MLDGSCDGDNVESGDGGGGYEVDSDGGGVGSDGVAE